MNRKNRHTLWESMQDPNDITFIYGQEKRKLLNQTKEIVIDKYILEQAAASIKKAIYDTLK